MSACAPLAMGEVSDDETPSIRGAGASKPVLAWFEAQGVAPAAATRWYSARFGEAPSEETECRTLKVGDNAEEALLCGASSRMSFSGERFTTIVVRKKAPVIVLDVALGLRAMDWPDVRHLDLALELAPDGKSAELRDRAPDGAVLVEPPSACREREKRFDACEQALKESQPLDPRCPVVVAEDGTKKIFRDGAAHLGSIGYPATLHDCAGAKANMAQLMKGTARSMAGETRSAAAFIDKACRERGHYEWKGDRFVWTR